MTTLVATRSHIREATITDVPRLVEMATAQLTESYLGTIPPDAASLEPFIANLIAAHNSLVLVAEQSDRLIGMIGLVLYRHPQSGAMTAGEVAWWMDPTARGAGRDLLARAECWAFERGALCIQMIAPASNPRVGALYERRGYRPLETSYQAPVSRASNAVQTHEGVLPDFAAYRAAVLAQSFGTVEPHTGAVFHGISEACSDVLPNWIRTRYPMLTPTLTFARQSPEGQQEPHYIHTDLDMGEWTAIAYLSDDPAPGDGTTFWRWKETNCVRSLWATDQLSEWAAWRDRSQWEAWMRVGAVPNRVILFPAAYFHSRALLENYGAGDSARLIQVVFGTGTLPPESRH